MYVTHRSYKGYQGHTKLSPPEPNYSGDWGDFVAFTHHLRRLASERGVDLLFVDTGDLHDGNGLSDAFPTVPSSSPNFAYAVNGHVSDQVFALADYDILTIGNHELYNFSVAKDVYEDFVPRWHGRYLTSNVNISLSDSPGSIPRSRPIGQLYTRFQTPHQNLTIQSYGILFDFRLAAQGISVQSPEEMVHEPWFQASLNQTHIDAFVIAGHMPVTGHKGWEAVHSAIRAKWPTTPILMLAGHTHVRDCRMLDRSSMVLESGRYLETIGFMSISNVRDASPTLFRRYIDANPRNYAFHANLTSVKQLSTARGRYVRAVMDAVALAWDLPHLYGIVPQDYFLDRYPAHANHSLLALLTRQILPEVVRPAHPRHTSHPTLLLINSGSQRFDVLAGPFTKNDQYITSPFRDNFLFISNVPWRVAKTLVHGLNKRGATHNEQPAQHAAQGAVDSIFHRYLGRQWLSYWTNRFQSQDTSTSQSAQATTSGRPEQARRLEEFLAQLEARDSQHTLLRNEASLGYVTIDDCPGIGDDTQHTPISYSPMQPDYVAANPDPEPEQDETLVDVVFVDFILKPIVALLNAGDKQRTYSVDQAEQWGNVSTQWLYPLYAEQAWMPDDLTQAWSELDFSATLHGYPALSKFDTHSEDPYETVRGARAESAPLVFQ
ncbi:hypothetical protein MPSI1_003968 [Malassezia psittaci]|uniref:Calcineurin-like phosphoesterase domain-containing protein n=1 Tax=Malassezia psittaci TaxID=1821823 RepID=A0AAF0JMP2_9BASI|nr:hypothetical protein MPSI1_003968 [Malassezia psittaci]